MPVRAVRRWGIRGVLAAGLGATAYVLTVRGALTLDLGVGRSVRSLGPLRATIDAPRETVFDVVADPYLGRTPRAMENKLRVLDRGKDLVLAAHFTPIPGGLVATTVETVHFDPPQRISFRLVRGPVPYVTETFELRNGNDGGTDFVYTGEMGTDLWALGRWWGNVVATAWERTVERSIESIKAEAERRTTGGGDLSQR